MRNRMIAGNWKMNETFAEGVELAEASGLFTCVWLPESVALGVGLLCG